MEGKMLKYSALFVLMIIFSVSSASSYAFSSVNDELNATKKEQSKKQKKTKDQSKKVDDDYIPMFGAPY